ncbi:hypothetical protein BKA70DRAFT_1293892 [Coprinopsis sp. MPI-PUGE-AT-0042]|nr:hypothetical protein BKA70DRAFT_1293892 [Coprinopsis sp. MPI-PUGE-AT-0042]
MSVIKLKYGVITPLVCVIIFILTFTLAPNLPIISSLSSYLSLIPIIDLSKTPMSSSSNAPWSSPLSGFLDRATRYSDTASFKPPRSSLELVVLRNAPVETEGFTLALFSSDGSNQKETFAVDAKGAVYTLTPDDASGILKLAHDITELPTTEEFRNTWILKALRTSQPIDRILIPKGKCAPEVPEENYEKEFNEVSVQGFNYEERELRERTAGEDVLPQALWELAGVVLEGRSEGEGNRGPGDESVVSRVKGMVRNAF